MGLIDLLELLDEEPMALHKQVAKRKQYETNYTLVPGAYDKFLIHHDEENNCWRVTFYSCFSERYVNNSLSNVTGKLNPRTGRQEWRRKSWTYQKMFKHEIEALEFAQAKAKTKKSYGSLHRPVILLQLGVDTEYEG